MFQQVVVPGIFSILGILFNVWYSRYYSRNDQWRDTVNATLADHATKLAVTQAVTLRIGEDIHEIKQDMKTILLNVLGAKDGRRSDA